MSRNLIKEAGIGDRLRRAQADAMHERSKGLNEEAIKALETPLVQAAQRLERTREHTQAQAAALETRIASAAKHRKTLAALVSGFDDLPQRRAEKIDQDVRILEQTARAAVREPKPKWFRR